ncbi:hypothetical protein Tco_1417841, partial [Tanacetum coccineum]
AALRYRDKYNKVGYLQKTTGSNDYHQILDFLRASHIRSPELGPRAILATIDETPYTITEDLVRSQLQLAVHEQVFHLNGGFWSTQFFSVSVPSMVDEISFGSLTWLLLQTILGIETSLTRQYQVFKLSSKLFANMKLNFERQPMQLLAVMLPQDQRGPFVLPPKDTKIPLHLHHLTKSLRVSLQGHTSGVQRTFITLTAIVSVFYLCAEEKGGEQAVDLDALIALANAAVTVDSNNPPGGASNNHAASSHIPTDVPTGGDFVPAHSTSPSRDPFKGKGVAKPSSPISERTKKQLANERLSEIEAVIDIMAQVHANAGLSFELLGADVNDDNFAKSMVVLINQRTRAFAEQTAKEKTWILSPRNKKDSERVVSYRTRHFKDLKSTEASFHLCLMFPKPPVVSYPQISGQGGNDKTFIKVVSDEDSEDEVLMDSQAGDVSYPLSVKLMERMLKHKLEIDKDVVSNDMTTAEQLIRFIKNQIAAAQVSPV